MRNPIKITHTTDCSMPYVLFYDGIFIEDEKYLLGNYQLKYSDGTVASLPVRYGTHIGFSSYKDPYLQNDFRQLSYGTLPIKTGDRYVFEAVYENPYPDKSLISISYVSTKENFDVQLMGFLMENTTYAKHYSKTDGNTSVEDIVGVQV